jgi:hypothetical protein
MQSDRPTLEPISSNNLQQIYDSLAAAPRVIQTMTRSCLKRLQIMLTPLNPSISISMSAMVSSSFHNLIKQFCAAM